MSDGRSDTLSQSQWTGVAFPFRMSPATGMVELSSTGPSNIDHIIESIQQILGTVSADPKSRRGGERVMLPEFGARLLPVVFQVNDDRIISYIRNEVYKSLLRWEPRIKPTSIDVKRTGDATLRNQVTVTVNFEVRATKQLGEALSNIRV